jgi:hypothetical protein
VGPAAAADDDAGVDLSAVAGSMGSWAGLRQRQTDSVGAEGEVEDAVSCTSEGETVVLHRPAVLINADVLSGPVAPIIENAPEALLTVAGGSRSRVGGRVRGGCRFNAEGVVFADPALQIAAARSFVQAVGESLPSATLSLGWTTMSEDGEYDAAFVGEMRQVISGYADMGMSFTFAVRGSYIAHARSADALNDLLRPSEFTSLTVWSNVRLPCSTLALICSAFPAARVMTDVPAPPAVVSAAATVATAGAASSSAVAAHAATASTVAWCTPVRCHCEGVGHPTNGGSVWQRLGSRLRGSNGRALAKDEALALAAGAGAVATGVTLLAIGLGFGVRYTVRAVARALDSFSSSPSAVS